MNLFAKIEQAKSLFASLDEVLSDIRAEFHVTTVPKAHAETAKRRRAKTTKAAKNEKGLRAFQGAYMAAVRQLNAAQKAQVKKVRMDDGYEKAIALAKELKAA